MPIKFGGKIDVKHVLESSLWKPGKVEFEYTHPTNSWFNIDSMKSECSRGIKFKEVIKTNTIRAKAIILYPTEVQKNILLEWNEIYRQMYNLTNKFINNIELINGKRKIPSYITLRKELVLNINLKTSIDRYKFPIHSLTEAIKDCLKAYKSAFANLRNKNIPRFRIRNKRKLCSQTTICLESGYFSKNKNAFCVNALGLMKSSQPIKNITKDCRLTYNSRNNRFTLMVPYDKSIELTCERYNICSLDPGMRTFQTVYTPAGNCYEICNSETSPQITKLIARIHKKDLGNPSGHKAHINRLRIKLRNKIDDLHWKSARFLLKTFKVVVIGNLSTQAIVSNDLQLRSETKDYCHALSHFTFRQRLLSKGEELGCKVVVQDESYTSKTCGGCGELNNTLGSSKDFSCESCEYACDRDVNGARNILLKSMN